MLRERHVGQSDAFEKQTSLGDYPWEQSDPGMSNSRLYLSLKV